MAVAEDEVAEVLVAVGALADRPVAAPALLALAAADRERDDDAVADLELLVLGADLDHLAHELVADDVARLHAGHEAVVEVQVGAADRAAGGLDDGVARVLDRRDREPSRSGCRACRASKGLSWDLRKSQVSRRGARRDCIGISRACRDREAADAANAPGIGDRVCRRALRLRQAWAPHESSGSGSPAVSLEQRAKGRPVGLRVSDSSRSEDCQFRNVGSGVARPHSQNALNQ